VTGPTSRDPWADPSTPTQEGPPYAGPPPTAPQYPPPHGYGPPQPYGVQPYGVPAYGVAPYGVGPYGGWAPGVPWGPSRPSRPGQVVGAAVLTFVQAAFVLIASLYLWFFASLADLATTGVDGAYSSATVRGLAAEGTALALVQTLSAVALVAGGILALNRRTRAAFRWLVAVHAAQVLLAGYWAVRLLMLFDDVPGDDPTGVFLTFTLFFAAGPVVALGLALSGAGRRWFDGTP
jgi:hypothetical protein